MQIKIDNIIKEAPLESNDHDDTNGLEKAKIKLNGHRQQDDDQVDELILANGWRSRRKSGSRKSKADENSANGIQNGTKAKTNGGLTTNNNILIRDNLKLIQRAKKALADLSKTDEDEQTTESKPTSETNSKAESKFNSTATATATPTATTRADTTNDDYKAEIVWFNIFLFVILHSALPVAAYKLVTEWPLRTFLWSVFCIYASGLGVTGGAHRLWSHRSYKASKPVEILLMLLQTMAGQNSIYTWSRDHRVHHKFSETHADPHNIKRGFFFAHMGWLCCKKHPDVKEKGKLIDMSDLEANPIVMFQHRHFWWLSVLCNVAAPMAVPIYFWNESYSTALVFPFMLRYLITLHGTWLVNSAAHYHGSRPYDERIEARESPLVILTALGEGFHNYHHTFPFDYSTSEFGKYLNITTAFIDVCASMGLTYDLRKVDPKMVRQRQLRTGDGTGLEEEEQQQKANGCGAKERSDDDEHEFVMQSSANEDSHRRSSSIGSPLDHIIQELPYISGSLTSMKYTM